MGRFHKVRHGTTQALSNPSRSDRQTNLLGPFRAKADRQSCHFAPTARPATGPRPCYLDSTGEILHRYFSRSAARSSIQIEASPLRLGKYPELKTARVTRPGRLVTYDQTGCVCPYDRERHKGPSRPASCAGQPMRARAKSINASFANRESRRMRRAAPGDGRTPPFPFHGEFNIVWQ